jgi:hypothetical protein
MVQVSARVEEYLPLAVHEEFEGSLPDQWYDVIVLKIITPKEWEGTDLNVEFRHKMPSSQQMQQVGSTWEFKIEKRRIVGEVPNIWPPGTVNWYPTGQSSLKDLKKIN